MKHIYEKTGHEFEIGKLVDSEGCSYDMSVITKWDFNDDCDQSPVIVDYYFGGYNEQATNYYIEQFLKRQETLKTALEFLKGKLIVDEDFMDKADVEKLKQTIESLGKMITPLN